MKKILGIIAIVLVVAVAGVLLYATTQPDTFRVARSQSIKASPDKIYAYINDFRSWPGWSRTTGCWPSTRCPSAATWRHPDWFWLQHRCEE